MSNQPEPGRQQLSSSDVDAFFPENVRPGTSQQVPTMPEAPLPQYMVTDDNMWTQPLSDVVYEDAYGTYEEIQNVDQHPGQMQDVYLLGDEDRDIEMMRNGVGSLQVAAHEVVVDEMLGTSMNHHQYTQQVPGQVMMTYSQQQDHHQQQHQHHQQQHQHHQQLQQHQQQQQQHRHLQQQQQQHQHHQQQQQQQQYMHSVPHHVRPSQSHVIASAPGQARVRYIVQQGAPVMELQPGQQIHYETRPMAMFEGPSNQSVAPHQGQSATRPVSIVRSRSKSQPRRPLYGDLEDESLAYLVQEHDEDEWDGVDLEDHEYFVGGEQEREAIVRCNDDEHAQSVPPPKIIQKPYFPPNLSPTEKKEYLLVNYKKACDRYFPFANVAVLEADTRYKPVEAFASDLYRFHSRGAHIHGFFRTVIDVRDPPSHDQTRYIQDIQFGKVFPLFPDYEEWDDKMRDEFRQLSNRLMRLFERKCFYAQSGEAHGKAPIIKRGPRPVPKPPRDYAEQQRVEVKGIPKGFQPLSSYTQARPVQKRVQPQAAIHVNSGSSRLTVVHADNASIEPVAVPHDVGAPRVEAYRHNKVVKIKRMVRDAYDRDADPHLYQEESAPRPSEPRTFVVRGPAGPSKTLRHQKSTANKAIRMIANRSIEPEIDPATGRYVVSLDELRGQSSSDPRRYVIRPAHTLREMVDSARRGSGWPAVTDRRPGARVSRIDQAPRFTYNSATGITQQHQLASESSSSRVPLLKNAQVDQRVVRKPAVLSENTSTTDMSSIRDDHVYPRSHSSGRSATTSSNAYRRSASSGRTINAGSQRHSGGEGVDDLIQIPDHSTTTVQESASSQPPVALENRAPVTIAQKHSRLPDQNTAPAGVKGPAPPGKEKRVVLIRDEQGHLRRATKMADGSLFIRQRPPQKITPLLGAPRHASAPRAGTDGGEKTRTPTAGTVFAIHSMARNDEKRTAKQVEQQWKRSQASVAPFSHNATVVTQQDPLMRTVSEHTIDYRQKPSAPRSKSRRRDALVSDEVSADVQVQSKSPRGTSRKPESDRDPSAGGRKSRSRGPPRQLSRLCATQGIVRTEEEHQEVVRRRVLKQEEENAENVEVDVVGLDDALPMLVKELIDALPPPEHSDVQSGERKRAGRPPKKFRGRMAKQKQALRDAVLAEKEAIKQRELPVLELALKAVDDPSVEIPDETPITVDSLSELDPVLLHEVGEVLKEMVAEVSMKELEPKKEGKGRSRRCWEHLPEREPSKRQEYRAQKRPPREQSPPLQPVRGKPRGRNSEKYRQAQQRKNEDPGDLNASFSAIDLESLPSEDFSYQDVDTSFGSITCDSPPPKDSFAVPQLPRRNVQEASARIVTIADIFNVEEPLVFPLAVDPSNNGEPLRAPPSHLAIPIQVVCYDKGQNTYYATLALERPQSQAAPVAVVPEQERLRTVFDGKLLAPSSTTLQTIQPPTVEAIPLASTVLLDQTAGNQVYACPSSSQQPLQATASSWNHEVYTFPTSPLQTLDTSTSSWKEEEDPTSVSVVQEQQNLGTIFDGSLLAPVSTTLQTIHSPTVEATPLATTGLLDQTAGNVYFCPSSSQQPLQAATTSWNQQDASTSIAFVHQQEHLSVEYDPFGASLSTAQGILAPSDGTRLSTTSEIFDLNSGNVYACPSSQLQTLDTSTSSWNEEEVICPSSSQQPVQSIPSALNEQLPASNYDDIALDDENLVDINVDPFFKNAEIDSSDEGTLSQKMQKKFRQFMDDSPSTSAPPAPEGVSHRGAEQQPLSELVDHVCEHYDPLTGRFTNTTESGSPPRLPMGYGDFDVLDFDDDPFRMPSPDPFSFGAAPLCSTPKKECQECRERRIEAEAEQHMNRLNVPLSPLIRKDVDADPVFFEARGTDQMLSASSTVNIPGSEVRGARLAASSHIPLSAPAPRTRMEGGNSASADVQTPRRTAGSISFWGTCLRSDDTGHADITLNLISKEENRLLVQHSSEDIVHSDRSRTVNVESSFKAASSNTVSRDGTTEKDVVGDYSDNETDGSLLTIRCSPHEAASSSTVAKHPDITHRLFGDISDSDSDTSRLVIVDSPHELRSSRIVTKGTTTIEKDTVNYSDMDVCAVIVESPFEAISLRIVSNETTIETDVVRDYSDSASGFSRAIIGDSLAEATSLSIVSKEDTIEKNVVGDSDSNIERPRLVIVDSPHELTSLSIVSEEDTIEKNVVGDSDSNIERPRLVLVDSPHELTSLSIVSEEDTIEKNVVGDSDSNIEIPRLVLVDSPHELTSLSIVSEEDTIEKNVVGDSDSNIERPRLVFVDSPHELTSLSIVSEEDTIEKNVVGDIETPRLVLVDSPLELTSLSTVTNGTVIIEKRKDMVDDSYSDIGTSSAIIADSPHEATSLNIVSKEMTIEKDLIGDYSDSDIRNSTTVISKSREVTSLSIVSKESAKERDVVREAEASGTINCSEVDSAVLNTSTVEYSFAGKQSAKVAEVLSNLRTVDRVSFHECLSNDVPLERRQETATTCSYECTSYDGTLERLQVTIPRSGDERLYYDSARERQQITITSSAYESVECIVALAREELAIPIGPDQCVASYVTVESEQADVPTTAGEGVESRMAEDLEQSDLTSEPVDYPMVDVSEMGEDAGVSVRDRSTPPVVPTSQTGEVVRVKTVEELAKIAQEVSSSVRRSSRRSKRHASRKNVELIEEVAKQRKIAEYLDSRDPANAGFSPATHLEQRYFNSPDLFGFVNVIRKKKSKISKRKADDNDAPSCTIVTRSRKARQGVEPATSAAVVVAEKLHEEGEPSTGTVARSDDDIPEHEEGEPSASTVAEPAEGMPDHSEPSTVAVTAMKTYEESEPSTSIAEADKTGDVVEPFKSTAVVLTGKKHPVRSPHSQMKIALDRLWRRMDPQLSPGKYGLKRKRMDLSKGDWNMALGFAAAEKIWSALQKSHRWKIKPRSPPEITYSSITTSRLRNHLISDFTLTMVKPINPIVSYQPDMARLMASMHPMSPLRLSRPRVEGSLENAIAQYDKGVECILAQIKCAMGTVEGLRSTMHWTLHCFLDAQLYVLDVLYELWEFTARSVQVAVFNPYQCAMWEKHHQLYDARMYSLLFEMNASAALSTKLDTYCTYIRLFEEWNRKSGNYSSVYNHVHGLALAVVKLIAIPSAFKRLQRMTRWNSEARSHDSSEEVFFVDLVPFFQVGTCPFPSDELDMEGLLLGNYPIVKDSLEHLLSYEAAHDNNRVDSFSFLFPSHSVIGLCRDQVQKEVINYCNRYAKNVRLDRHQLSLLSPIARSYILSCYHESRAKTLMRDNVMNLVKNIKKVNVLFDELSRTAKELNEAEFNIPCGQVVFDYNDGKLSVCVNSLTVENDLLPSENLKEEARRIMGDAVKNTVFDPSTLTDKQKELSLSRIQKSVDLVKNWVMTIPTTYNDEGIENDDSRSILSEVESMEVASPCGTVPRRFIIDDEECDDDFAESAASAERRRRRGGHSEIVSMTILGRKIQYTVDNEQGVVKMRTGDHLMTDAATDNLTATNTFTTASFGSLEQTETMKIERSQPSGEINWAAMIRKAVVPPPPPVLLPDVSRSGNTSEFQTLDIMDAHEHANHFVRETNKDGEFLDLRKEQREKIRQFQKVDYFERRRNARFEAISSGKPLEMPRPAPGERDKLPLYAGWLREALQYADIERKRLTQLKPINHVGRCRAARSEVIRGFDVPVKQRKRSNSTPAWHGRTIYDHFGEYISLGMARLEYEVAHRNQSSDAQSGAPDDTITHYFVSRNNSPSTMADPGDLLENPYDRFRPTPLVKRKRTNSPLLESSLVKRVHLSDPPVFAPLWSRAIEAEEQRSPCSDFDSSSEEEY